MSDFLCLHDPGIILDEAEMLLNVLLVKPSTSHCISPQLEDVWPLAERQRWGWRIKAAWLWPWGEAQTTIPATPASQHPEPGASVDICKTSLDNFSAGTIEHEWFTSAGRTGLNLANTFNNEWALLKKVIVSRGKLSCESRNWTANVALTVLGRLTWLASF